MLKVSLQKSKELRDRHLLEFKDTCLEASILILIGKCVYPYVPVLKEN